MNEMEALKNWVAEQPEKPILHVNGNDHPTAVITVDFGQPVSGVNLSGERNTRFTDLMKAACKSLSRRRGNVRVNYDHHQGVFWASIS